MAVSFREKLRAKAESPEGFFDFVAARPGSRSEEELRGHSAQNDKQRHDFESLFVRMEARFSVAIREDEFLDALSGFHLASVEISF